MFETVIDDVYQPHYLLLKLFIKKKDVKLAANRLTPVLITIIDRVPRNCMDSNPRPIIPLWSIDRNNRKKIFKTNTPLFRRNRGYNNLNYNHFQFGHLTYKFLMLAKFETCLDLYKV